MDVLSLLRGQLKEAHEQLEAAVAGLRREHVEWLPPGGAHLVGATYSQAVIAEDVYVNALLKGGRPLFASTWDGKVGVNACMPLPGPVWDDFEWPSYSYDEWARSVQVSLPMVRRYARAVYAASDDYFASLPPTGLARRIDLSAMGHGEVTLAWVVSSLLIGNLYHACGEIACLKRLQGLLAHPGEGTSPGREG